MKNCPSEYHRNTVHIISVVKPTRCTDVSNLFYFGMTLYMFRTVFPSITSSSRLYIQQHAYVKQILLSASASGSQIFVRLYYKPLRSSKNVGSYSPVFSKKK